MILILFLTILAGCATPETPKTMLDTTICDPTKEPCFSVSVPFLEQHFFIEEQNEMLKKNLKRCQERL